MLVRRWAVPVAVAVADGRPHRDRRPSRRCLNRDRRRGHKRCRNRDRRCPPPGQTCQATCSGPLPVRELWGQAVAWAAWPGLKRRTFSGPASARCSGPTLRGRRCPTLRRVRSRRARLRAPRLVQGSARSVPAVGPGLCLATWAFLATAAVQARVSQSPPRSPGCLVWVAATRLGPVAGSPIVRALAPTRSPRFPSHHCPVGALAESPVAIDPPRSPEPPVATDLVVAAIALGWATPIVRRHYQVIWLATGRVAAPDPASSIGPALEALGRGSVATGQRRCRVIWGTTVPGSVATDLASETATPS